MTHSTHAVGVLHPGVFLVFLLHTYLDDVVDDLLTGVDAARLLAVLRVHDPLVAVHVHAVCSQRRQRYTQTVVALRISTDSKVLYDTVAYFVSCGRPANCITAFCGG